MKAKALLKKVGYEIENDFEIHEIQIDSRLVEKNDIFIALMGTHTDGHLYIQEALENGAKLILTERKMPFHTIVMKNGHQTLSQLAYYFYQEPTKDIEVIGVTGTNGKTTTTTLLYQALKQAGCQVALIGTNGLYYPEGFIPLENTTPDVLYLMRYFKKCQDMQIHTVIMEVSSHALSLGRVEHIQFNIAVFTNLTRDHLDFHHDMESYFLAKQQLFASLTKDSFAILNADDMTYVRLKNHTSAKVLSYGIDQGDYKAKNITLGMSGTSFEVDGISVKSDLLSQANVYNLLAVYSVLRVLGYSKEKTAFLIQNCKPIEGRLEKVYHHDFLAVVDYAHSPDAIHHVLTFLSEIKKGRLIAVIGCGGERDKSKRPIMSQIACKKADFVILTSDNPRNENPKDILKDMLEGLNYSNYCVIVNRKEAIEKAIALACFGDIVAVLGKGHECYQIIGEKKYHFSDKEEILRVIKGE